MLTKKQIKLLELLEDQMSDCKDCNLWTGGYFSPYWTPKSKIIIIDSYPNFTSKAEFKKIFQTTYYHGYDKEQFAIISCTNCYDDEKLRSYESLEECDQWVRKFIRIIEPTNILLLGKTAIEKFFPGEGYQKKIIEIIYYNLKIKMYLCLIINHLNIFYKMLKENK